MNTQVIPSNVRFLPRQDIFQSNAVVLCNPVNLKGVINAGLALKFDHKYPGLLENYQEAIELGWLRSGTVWPYWITTEAYTYRLVLNCPTKIEWHDPSPEPLLILTIKAIAHYCRTKSIPRIAVPKLGCGLSSGLDWSRIRTVLVGEALFTPATKWDIHGEPPA